VVPFDGNQVGLGRGEDRPTAPLVLALQRNGENLQPDPLDVNPDNVLPGEHGDQFVGLVLHDVQVPALERRVGQVVEQAKAFRLIQRST
jgi:hypothetical protein